MILLESKMSSQIDVHNSELSEGCNVTITFLSSDNKEYLPVVGDDVPIIMPNNARHAGRYLSVNKHRFVVEVNHAYSGRT